MSNALAEKPASAVASFSKFMDGFKGQMMLCLPKHLTPDRMTRLALTQFSSNPKLQECAPRSIAASMMTASALGLEPGVNGQCFLVPYYDKREKMMICQCVPGWKGLTDIANRSGRCTVWTGAVFQGDHFEYALGDKPFIQHKPGDEDNPAKLTHLYAVGRVNGSEWPVIEVWSVKKVTNHRDKYNKVGAAHYSFGNLEMYGRKVPLLQVLKYMPASIELSNAIAATNAAENGRNGNVVIEGNFVHIPDRQDDDQDEGNGQDQHGEKQLPACSAEAFDKKKAGWKSAIEKGAQSVNDLITTIETRELLTTDQKVEIASWAVKSTEGAPA